MMPAVEDAIERLGLEPAVRLLGRIGEEALVNWYRLATVSVMPTQSLEGFGLSTAESLACGTPVVATPLGGNLLVGFACRTNQHDPTPLRQRLRRRRPPHPPLQRVPLLIGQRQLGHWPPNTRHLTSISLFS